MLAIKKIKKWLLKTNTCKAEDPEFDGIERSYEDFVNQCSCIDFHERNRAITNPRPFELNLKKKMMNNCHFYPKSL